ncbi:LysR substrate-binding domain-containing protein [Sorangium sp. So ce204]|uniref:LysR substrate-binding domain-containing protein n=1 Tax=Sorangium sp. So ce204 TaxID=3133288 RepID=UPI003F617EEE
MSPNGSRSNGAERPVGALERGDVDLALVPRADIDGLEQFVFRPIVDDEHVIVTRRGHPLARGRATFERYLGCGHVVVGTSLPGLSPVQRAIARLERSRDVQAWARFDRSTR